LATFRERDLDQGGVLGDGDEPRDENGRERESIRCDR